MEFELQNNFKFLPIYNLRAASVILRSRLRNKFSCDEKLIHSLKIRYLLQISGQVFSPYGKSKNLTFIQDKNFHTCEQFTGTSAYFMDMFHAKALCNHISAQKKRSLVADPLQPAKVY